MKVQSKKKYLLRTMILLSLTTTFTMQADDMNNIFQQIYEVMYRSMIDKNIDLLDNLLDDDFVLVHMNGMRQTKKEYLKSIENGTLNYYSCDSTMLEVSEQDDNTHITGRSKVTAAVFGGSPHIWPLQLDIDLMNKNQDWKITKITASTY